MTAILFALVAMVGWAVGDLINAYAARDVGNRHAYFWWLVIAFIFSSFYIPFAGPIGNVPMFLVAIGLNIFFAWGSLLYFRALEIGNVSLVGVIGGSFPFVTVLLSLILYGERLNIFQFISFMFILAGLILVSLNPSVFQGRRLKHLLSDPGILPAFAALLIWGIYQAVIRTPIESIGWFWAGYPAYWFFLILLLLGMVDYRALAILKRKKSLGLIIAAAILASSGNFSYNLGLSTGYTSVVAPIAGSFPVLFVLLSRFIFRDPLSRTQAAGIVLSLMGIVCMSFSG